MKTFKEYFEESIIYDKDIIVNAIMSILPHIDILGMQLIGSSALSPEDLKTHGIEKHGIEDYQANDIDVEVLVSGASNEDIEQWAFSDESQELEDMYGWDVQLRNENL